jgi:hypothetical protein
MLSHNTMSVHLQIKSQSAQWPRVRKMPRCSMCADLMVAPESSVLTKDGVVTYLWCCERCGQSVVTECSGRPD